MLVDVLVYDQPTGESSYRACDAGAGAAIVGAHRREIRRRRLVGRIFGVLLAIPLAIYGIVFLGEPLLTVLAFASVGTVVLVLRSRGEPGPEPVPELVAESIRLEEAERRYDLDSTPE